jgi:demethylmenaquinone methyltransferase / 2-methoxy-6-polyprenyl-1,4-benzoquinol methylase
MPTPTSSTPSADHTESHFGFTPVRLNDKQNLVDDVFRKVAARYDVMNDVMSFGLHRVWKDVMVAKLKPRRSSGFHHLDVAGGTGDVAFRIAQQGNSKTQISVLDINTDMLAVGKERAAQQGLHEIDFIEANAESLPFADNTFDGYTIAFGIRNVPRIDVALRDAYRVLRRGGRFLCLEFSEVTLPLLDKVYDHYSFTAIPAFGKIITGDGQPYRYLVESIRQFPNPERFCSMIEQAGFERVSFQSMSGNIVALHSGWKL